VNSEAKDGVTFRDQSEKWLADLAVRKRKPIAPSTLRVFNSYVRRLTPVIGETKLTEINNGIVRNLVQQLDAEKLSPKTINELVAVVKQVVGSLVDKDGNKVHQREWNHAFIDLPVVSAQKQPCLSAKDVDRCIKNAASDQEKLFYAVLAGSGLRVAEALAIHTSGRDDQTSWNPLSQSIDVHSSVFNGRELARVKTAAGKRTIDLDPQLSALIANYVQSHGIQKGDYLFQSRNHGPMHQKTARERLAKHGIPGFHSFRRYRITRLREFGVPEDIVRYWVGHEGQSITDRYSKLGENAELRREWACRPGLLGFDLPDISEQRRTASRRTVEPISLTEKVARYEATDDDLPLSLFAEQSEHS